MPTLCVVCSSIHLSFKFSMCMWKVNKSLGIVASIGAFNKNDDKL
jgi:hypothetical protein